VRVLQSSVADTEARVDSVAAKDKNLNALSEKVDALAVRFEHLLAQADGLTQKQLSLDPLYDRFAQLDDLSIAIRTEKHTYTHQGGKPHNTQHVPMVTRQQAYDKAIAVLTPEQQGRLESLYQIPAPAQPAPRKLTVPHGKP